MWHGDDRELPPSEEGTAQYGRRARIRCGHAGADICRTRCLPSANVIAITIIVNPFTMAASIGSRHVKIWRTTANFRSIPDHVRDAGLSAPSD